MAEDTEGRHVLATAIETFEREKSDLLEKAEEQRKAHRLTSAPWVLIHETEVEGIYDDRVSALHAGYKAYPGKPILVRQVLEHQEPLTARTVWIGPD